MMHAVGSASSHVGGRVRWRSLSYQINSSHLAWRWLVIVGNGPCPCREWPDHVRVGVDKTIMLEL